MVFKGVYTAVYDYLSQSEGELELREGDVLCILEKSDIDDWWKAKKMASNPEDEEPTGLIPNNYIEERQPELRATALYDYHNQTDEEIAFTENSELLVYDASDPDWVLASVANTDQYGFAPANYLEILPSGNAEATPSAAAAEVNQSHYQPVPQHILHTASELEPESEAEAEAEPALAPKSALKQAPALAPAPSSTPPLPQRPAREESPAAAIASVLHRTTAAASSHQNETSDDAPITSRDKPDAGIDRHQQIESSIQDSTDDQPPPLPRRPRSEVSSTVEPAPQRPRFREVPTPKRTHVQSSPPFPGDAAAHSARFPSGYHLYNISEMVSVMGKRKKMPTTLGINLTTGSIFISPEKSSDGPHQQWSVDKLKHYSIEGKHVFMDLVRPSKAVDLHAGTKDTAQEIVSILGEVAGKYRAEGLREIIAAGESGARRKGRVIYEFDAINSDEVSVVVDEEVIILDDKQSDDWWKVRRMRTGEEGVVPSSYIELTGVTDEPSLAEGGLVLTEQKRYEAQEKAKEKKAASEKARPDSQLSKPKPDANKLRKWTDRSATFTVLAEFRGVLDDKIQLLKENGVKIAVPARKMSYADILYVEKLTGQSLLDDAERASAEKANPSMGVTVRDKPDHDWFDFFLKAGVGPHQCERYSQNFNRDSIDEAVLPDITSENLRTLGLKEGDILRVLKYLDNLYGRKSRASGSEEGGLFSGPGGILRNNTRKHPVSNSPANDVVDPKALQRQTTSPVRSLSPSANQGFENDAWEVKMAKPVPAPAKEPAPLTTAMTELSLLDEPLVPEPAHPVSPSAPIARQATKEPPQQQQPQPQPQPQLPPQPQQLPTQEPQQQLPLPPQQTQPQPQPPFQPPFQLPAPTQLQPQFQPQPQSQPQPQPQIPQPTNFASTMSAFGPSVPVSSQPTGMMLPPQQPQQPQPSVYQPTGFTSNSSPFASNPGVLSQPTGMILPSQSHPQPQFTQPTGFVSTMSPFGNNISALSQPQGMAFPQKPQLTQQSPFADRPSTSLFQRVQSQPTGMPPFHLGSFSNDNPPPLPPPLQPQPTSFSSQTTGPAPLAPQRTGAPPVRFGVKKDALTPQGTGRKANLDQASPSNPFGF